MNIDLDQPQFSLGEAVRIVPGLTVDMVQNWDKRGVLSEETASRPKKNAQIKWSVRNLIVMRILVDASRFGFKPSWCVALAREVAREVDAFVAAHAWGEYLHDGVPQYLFSADASRAYRRLIVTPEGDGAFVAQIVGGDAASENQFRTANFFGAYLVIEADLIFADTINATAIILSGRR